MRSMVGVFLLVFVLIGLAIAGNGAYTLWKAHRTRSWVRVEGRIVKSEVVTKSGDDGPTLAPEIRYVYEAAGGERTGKQIFVGDGMSSSSGRYAERYCRRYPVGAAVSVYHDPADPDAAVLEPGVNRKAFIGLAFGLGFALFGGWFYLLFWLFD